MNTARLVFWQNIISPHQIPYIKHLANDSRINQVLIIVPNVLNKERLDMGWNVNDFLKIPTIRFEVNPKDSRVIELLNHEQESSIHLFSGIRGDKYVYSWFKKSLNYSLIRGIISEGPSLYRKPLIFHVVRFLLQDYRYISKIKYVLAIGSAYTYYSFFSKKWSVIPFTYCVEGKYNNDDLLVERVFADIRIGFCGSLIKRKNVISLLKAIEKLHLRYPVKLHIYGDGKEKKSLINYSKKRLLADKVFFHGYYEISQAKSIISDFDILVLPSIYDGWGAVINEAIMVGTYVVCSNKCGASLLLKNNDKIGLVYDSSIKDLTRTIDKCCNNISAIRSKRDERIKWSEKIKGKTVAKYLVERLFTSDPFVEPWLVK